MMMMIASATFEQMYKNFFNDATEYLGSSQSYLEYCCYN